MIMDNNGMAFVAAFSVYAILLVLTATFLWMTDSDLNISTNHRDTAKALYAGEAGLEYGIYNLLADWNNWTGTPSPISLGDGRFEVAVTSLTYDRKEILATGFVDKSQRQARVIIIPPAFRYAVFSTRTVSLQATTAGSSGLVGTGDEGDVHSNSSVTTSGAVTVEGTITQVTPAVLIPTVDMNAYRTDPRTNYATGNLTINAANQGSYQNMIVYRTGNITVNANTGPITLNGTTLVAQGNISITKSGGGTGSYAVTITPNDEPLVDTAYPSMVTETGSISTTAAFTNNIYAKGLIYTRTGQINLRNLIMDKGSVMSGRTTSTGVTLTTTAGRNWRVIYDNTILNTNRPKYFTPPVAAASLYWKEVY